MAWCFSFPLIDENKNSGFLRSCCCCRVHVLSGTQVFGYISKNSRVINIYMITGIHL
jgi:hypothetical protein